MTPAREHRGDCKCNECCPPLLDLQGPKPKLRPPPPAPIPYAAHVERRIAEVEGRAAEREHRARCDRDIRLAYWRELRAAGHSITEAFEIVDR